MIWSCPFAFIGLALAPVAFYFIARKARRQYELVEKSFSEDMLARLTRPRSKKLVAFKTVCLFLSLIAFVFVLAGPKSNELETAEFDTLGRDVFVLFDVSDSMMAEDVAPNRLSVAKLDVEDLLDAALGDRVGLIAFAGSAQVEIPLTTDYVFFRDLLRRIDTTTVRMAGTAIGDAVRLALKRFGSDPNRSRAIVLITDGEDHESLPLEAARNAKDANVPIFVVAIGDLKGAKIPEHDASGNRSYKTYDGEPVVSKPDVATLKEIAKLSGGRYYYADASLDLANVYKMGIDQLARSEITQETHRRYKDLYQPFLATGLFFFTLYYFMPTRNNVRGKKQNSFFTASLFLALGIFFFHQSAMTEHTVYADEPAAAADTKPEEQTPSKEANSDSAKSQAASSMSKREEARQFNQAMKLFSEGSQEPATEILESLSNARNKEVAGRSNYNLGAASLAKALEQSNELAAAPTAGADTGNGPKETQKAENTPTNPEELLAKYNGERKERDAKRRELEHTAQESAERFFKSAQSKKNVRDSNRNANAVVKWLEEKQKEESARELELRAEALPSPELRLNWLQGELQERIARLQKPAKKNSDYYQSLFDERRGLAELPNDAQTVADGYAERLTNPSTNANAISGAVPPNASKASEPIKIDSEGIEKIERAQAAFAEMQRNADSELTRYDAKSSRQSLQNARAQLDVMRDVADPYDGLVLRIDENEKKALDNLENLKLSDGAAIENYYWERERLRNSVGEVMRKAEDVVKNPPPQPQNDPEEVDLSDVFDEPASNSNEDSENEEAASEAAPPNPAGAKSREQRIAESANIALSKKDELTELFETAKKALEKDSAPVQEVDGSATEKIVGVQRKIEAILEEIARPLQDEQQQNQQNQQQNQDQQNDGQKDREQQDKQQDSQNQDKKNNQDKQSNDPKQDQKDKIPDELNEPPKDDSKEESKEQPKEQEKKPSSEKQEADNNQTSAQQKEKKELTPEEKEAEALMRQVERRQKDAAEMRAFIRNALKKREKSGKDW